PAACSRGERTWRWCRRKPALAGLILALHLVLALGLMGVLWEWRRATVSESQTLRTLYTADMNLAHQAWNEGSLQRAQKLLRAHLPQAGKEDLRGFEWRYLWRLCQDESRVTFTNVHFAGNSHGLALAADGQTLIAASDDSLKWLDRQKHREIRIITVGTNAIDGLSMSGDLPGLVAYHTDRIKAISPSGEELLGGGLAPGRGGGDLAFSPDGLLLASGQTDHSIRLWNLARLEIPPTYLHGHIGAVRSLLFSRDGNELYTGSIDGTVKVFDVSLKGSTNILHHP